MILRTPPPQRKRKAGSLVDHESPISDRRLVIYEDPLPVASLDPSDHMVCTYQCRQMVKSEVMDALTLAEKQVVGYQSRVEELEKDLTRSEEKRKKFGDQLDFVEQELAASKGREQALQQRLLKEVTNYQELYQNQVKRCCELEVQLRKEADLRKNAESSAAAAKEKVLDVEEKARRLSESSEREKKHLQKEIFYLQDEAKLSCSRLSAELEKMKIKADNAMKESKLLKSQMEELRERLNECLTQKSDLEHKVSSFTAPSRDVMTSAEAQTLVKQLQEELRNYEADVQEARKLKSFHANTELLKEKLLEEKGRREKAEAESVKLQEVQVNAETLKNELKMWKSLIDEIPGVLCLSDIPKKFACLQKETIDNLMEVGKVTAQLKELEISLESAKLCRQQAEIESALAKEKAEESILEVKRLKLMVGAVTEERDGLRKDAITSNKLNMVDSEGVATNASLLKELESSLAAKDEIIKALENDLHEQGEVINRQHDELKVLNESLNNEARRIKSLEREGDRLRAEISLLESKLGHGDYSTENTKVLRMVNTLTIDSEAKHTIEALRSELEKTKAKLQAVEELKGQSDAGNLIDAQISDKLAQLKGQIATLEKREERYKAVFAEKISVFRRACCSLFGYKIVMDDQQRPNGIPVTRFMLQSIYAQSDDEKLEFEYESGNTTILVTDYTGQADISHQVEIFIKKMNSIPAFTANLTMESFNKRTLC
uniref:Mitotic spindle assembly checkpoint protein MAD1 n=1 Tax=Anthurium amnicola TaxID=1678845 RepID=A0A1D1YB05_9ARAE